MATSANLPLGEFITTIDGKRCTAVPRTDISTQTTSTTSTLSSFSTISSSSAASQVLAPPAVQQTTTTPPPAAVTITSSSSSAAVVVAASVTTPEAASPAAVQPQVQTSVADTSVAASSTTNPLTASSQATTDTATATAPQSEPLQTDTQSAGAVPTSTIGTAAGQSSTSADAQNAAGSTATSAAAAAAEASASSTSSSSGIGSGSNNNRSAAAVAGGVIGGLALVSIVALLIWYWRRRVLKKRRSTLLTPLSAEPGPGYLRGKRGFPSLGRDSMIQPAPRSNKVKDALRAQYGRVRGHIGTLSRSGSIHSIAASHSSGRSVDMNRGNSQFMDTSPVIIGQERKGSTSFSAAGDGDMTIKERIVELWARFTGGLSRNRQQQQNYNEKNDIFAARGLGGDDNGTSPTRSRRLTNKPDFLTLLSMDDNEIDREAQRRRMSRTRGGSEGSGFAGLDLGFGQDPFGDVNAISYNNITNNNPFSDTNAIAGSSGPLQPSTYVQDIRRSRGQSVDTSTIDLNKAYDLRGLRIANGSSRPPSGSTTAAGRRRSTMYSRDSQVSAVSFESFATKRNKFRSDPFDLEPVSGSLPSSMDIPDLPFNNFAAAGVSPSGALSRPEAAHTRQISDGSSKYTSGLTNDTLDEWSDPGPDVGSAAQGGSVLYGSAL